MRRTAFGGIIVASVYAAVGLLMPGRPTRPLFDGAGPAAPYRWACPPAIYAPANSPPRGSTHRDELTAGGSAAASFATDDGQAAVVLKEGTFPARKGETQIVVTIDPLCPDTVGAPPAGMRYDGNAYRFTARYTKSKVDAVPAKAATVVVRFPIVATKLFRRDGEVWTDLNAQPVTTSLQIFSDTPKLGIFVAVGPPLETSAPPKGTFPAALVVSLGAAFAAVVAGLVARVRVRNRRRAERARGTRKPRDRLPPKGP